MDTLRQDIRFALRSLAASPGFTAIAAICIALGIAANVFVWTPMEALVLRPLPYRDSERVMHLSAFRTNEERHTYGSWSYPDFADARRELKDVFSDVGASVNSSFNVGGAGEPERLEGSRVSSNFFPMLGLTPAKGRFFRDDEENDARVVVIGYGVWERKFGSDPAIVGKTIPVDGVAHEVIGVMARGVRVPETQDLWVPLIPGEARGHRDWRFYQLTARLQPGVTVAQADARVVALMKNLEERYADTNRYTSAWVVPLNDLIAREVRPIFVIMIGAVAFVVLIACANVANLLLARGASRQREVAVRLTMGASRARIVRQLLTESLLLATIGGAMGLLLGSWMVDVFVTRMLPTTVPFWMTFDINRTVVLATVAVTAMTGIIFGVAPALHLSRPSLTETLKESGGRGSSASVGAGKTRNALVVTELALSMVLLVGAGLMVRSFIETQRAKLGFETENLLTFEVDLVGTRYASDTARAAFLRTVDQRLAALPGIRALGSTSQLPIAECCRSNPYFPEGKEYPSAGGPSAWYTRASSSYIPAMGMRITAGRSFTENDLAPGAAPVVIVDSILAAREWPGESAIGKRLSFGRIASAEAPLHTVVGVMSHLIARQVNEIPEAQVILPMQHGQGSVRWYVLRTASDPAMLIPAVRSTMRALDPDLPLAELASMDFVVKNRMFQPRVWGSMFALFATTALVLAMIGLYGVMSYLVAQRTRELGVRMALGADRSAVLRLVLGGGARLIGAGLLIGIPAAVGMSQLLRGLLYGVSASDPLTLVAIPALLTVVALIATWIPARRATRVDPMVALRSE